jgi:hypothetical protein
MGTNLSTSICLFFSFICSKSSTVQDSNFSLGYVSLRGINGCLIFSSTSLAQNGTKSVFSVFIVKKVFVRMIFLGFLIIMNGQPAVVVFFFHSGQFIVAVNFRIGFYDVPWFNHPTFMFHLENSMTGF